MVQWTVAATALVAITLSACGANGNPPSATAVRPADDAEPTAVGPCTPATELPGGDVANAPVDETALFPWDRDDPATVEGFEPLEIISGGPPPDGIRPIDAPCFEDVAAADGWLTDEASVMVVQVGGETRAYPLAIMTRHEIVNDVIAGVPVVVTYCPLCNSGLAFERTVDGQVLDFGTSGRLFQSNLVMYDRQAKSLWTQFTGIAVMGEPWVGTELTRLPTSLLGWAELAAAAPDALVLSRDTGLSREYGANPYPGYEGRGDDFLFRGPRDERIPPNERVVGLGDDEEALAIPLSRLQEEGTVALTIAGQDVVALWAPGQASALDGAQVDTGVDVGQTAVFVARTAAGDPLTFATAETSGRFTDAETGSTWNLLGEAVDGPLVGEQLTPVAHDDTFWFVWFAFRQHTTLAA